jgi:hypothetical protein
LTEISSQLFGYEEELARMHEVRNGDALRAAAVDLARHLPRLGRVLLLGGSQEGLALAAVITAHRRGAPTSWGPLELRNGLQQMPDGVRVFIVEPIDGGRGWRKLINFAYPEAEVLIPSRRLALAA